MNKAVFLDRDGVINRDKGYVYLWEEFEFLPGAIEAIKYFSLAGYALIIVSNQSGIARGYYTESQYQELTSRVNGYLSQRGIQLKGVYHCPHYVDGIVEELSIQCECRKPAPGMLLQAKRDHGLNMEQSVLIGDKASDIQAAHAAGVGRSYLVAPGNNSDAFAQHTDGIVTSLFDCANKLGITR